MRNERKPDTYVGTESDDLSAAAMWEKERGPLPGYTANADYAQAEVDALVAGRPYILWVEAGRALIPPGPSDPTPYGLLRRALTSARAALRTHHRRNTETGEDIIALQEVEAALNIPEPSLRSRVEEAENALREAGLVPRRYYPTSGLQAEDAVTGTRRVQRNFAERRVNYDDVARLVMSNHGILESDLIDFFYKPQNPNAPWGADELAAAKARLAVALTRLRQRRSDPFEITVRYDAQGRRRLYPRTTPSRLPTARYSTLAAPAPPPTAEAPVEHVQALAWSLQILVRDQPIASYDPAMWLEVARTLLAEQTAIARRLTVDTPETPLVIPPGMERDNGEN
jgi:hypothetical protein